MNTQITDLQQRLFKIIEPAMFNYPDKHYIDTALAKLEALLVEARLDELEQRVPRLEQLIKGNQDVGTGDLGGFNVGVNTALRADDDRIATLQSQLPKDPDYPLYEVVNKGP